MKQLAYAVANIFSKVGRSFASVTISIVGNDQLVEVTNNLAANFRKLAQKVENQEATDLDYKAVTSLLKTIAVDHEAFLRIPKNKNVFDAVVEDIDHDADLIYEKFEKYGKELEGEYKAQAYGV